MALLHYSPPLHPYIDIVYKDEDLLVMNKPSGLLSVPGKAKEHKDSLISRLNLVYPSATVVHRLDMATSGIMLFALNKAAHKHISQQFEKRQISKTYYAYVFGKPKQREGSVDLPLRCDWPNRPKQMVDFEHGKAALTHYEVLETFANYSRVKLKPVTGRSHQLRVHMLSLGHPILGDRLYANEDALKMSPRLCLHAADISLQHPVSGEAISFQSKPDFPVITDYAADI